LLVAGRIETRVPTLTRPRRTTRPRELEQSSVMFVLPNGARSDWISCHGQFDKVVFALDVPDIDWVPGGGAGVSLD